MADWNAGPTYTLGPISAAEGSPLGGFLAGIQGLSSNYAAGANVVAANPTAAGQVIAGRPVPSDVLAQAAATPQSDNPFVAGGNIVGGLFGTGVAAIGTVAGNAGNTAAPGVAIGTNQAATGAGKVGSAAVVGTGSGLLGGSLSGIGTALGSIGGAGGIGSGENVALLVGGAILLVALYLVATG